MSGGPLELEHLVRLRQDLRDAIGRNRAFGATPPDVIVTLARVMGEMLAKSGSSGVGPALGVHLLEMIREGVAEERDRARHEAETGAPTTYRAGAARHRRK